MGLNVNNISLASDINLLKNQIDQELKRRRFRPDLSGNIVSTHGYASTGALLDPDSNNPLKDIIAEGNAINETTVANLNVDPASGVKIKALNQVSAQVAAWSSTPIASNTNDCNALCAGLCVGGCSSGCTSCTSCYGECEDNCASDCYNGCGNGCGDSCSSGCENGCAGGCGGTCEPGGCAGWCWQGCYTSCGSICTNDCSNQCFQGGDPQFA